MSIQTIIDKSQQIEMDRRRMVGQSVSRSQRIKTSERSTAQPWKFKVTPPGSLPWTSSRGILEVIDLNDRVTEYQITLSNSAGMNYITAYQGAMTQGEINTITVSSTGTSTLTLTNLPSIGSTGVLFRPGDFIQPANSRYPYTVVSTATRGINTTTTVTLNRPVITSENLNLVGGGIRVGNSATWQVIVTGLPTYTLTPMRQVQFTGDFELIEKVI